MGKGRPRAVQKSLTHPLPFPSSQSPPIPLAPVFYPSESEFSDPLQYLAQIRPLAEPYGICRIVPPATWTPPPFSLSLSSFPTKSQPIHRLQSRLSSTDPSTFRLDYLHFLTSHLQKKPPKKSPVFEGEALDLCRLFNAVKRFGGYNEVCGGKRWAEVARFIRPGKKVSECAKHVLSQLYYEHLYDYEIFNDRKDDPEKSKMEFHTRNKRKKNNKNLLQEVENFSNEEFDQICEQCNSGLHGEVMLLCDRCNKGWHLYCLTPPLESIPSGNWYCLECINSDQDCFGFVPGKNRSLDEFRRLDDKVKRKWFGQRNLTRSQIEKKFWEIVEGKRGPVEVMYGNDLDTSIYGSGFPRPGDPCPPDVDPGLWKQYSESPWNLNNFPKLPGSILRTVREDITGVIVPWLYVGMLFSAFCWHVEDHCFYSINYLHWGEPKCWYGVPGSAADAFEQVMRNALPDLFDTQPDLLFQLVTMLNPSVLQQNGVPVYSVVQEPGSFVITFPRSFHGGFNSGLNCAEAVNFATADWLPHGGVGAELYRRYHKAAVLSHEELLFVVAKNGIDSKALPYLTEELERVFQREKRHREDLWVNGVVRSKAMPPKLHPQYVGTEEDPTCIICQQFLYLSAVACECRPASLVCIEHWKHLCECSPEKHQLIYRHTLAEFFDVIHFNLETGSSQKLQKKMNGGTKSFVQLAEDWLSNSYHILEMPFSDSNYYSALMDAEQFLWADHDMDSVRNMADRLTQAMKWSMRVRGLLSKIIINAKKLSSDRAAFSEVQELVTVNPVPCCLPEFDQLKNYADEAEKLISEINTALSSNSTILELELLHCRVDEFPIHLTEATVLSKEISSAKLLLKSSSKYLEEKEPGVIEISHLNKLKAEMQLLRVQLPNMDIILGLCREAESWKLRCEKFLRGPIKLKELEEFLGTTSNLTFNISELKLLREYQADACNWICQANDLLQSLNERTDYDNVVEELYSVLEAGDSLRVQVDELPIVEEELERSTCRKRASEALSTRPQLDAIEQLLTEATLLGIEGDHLFVKMSEVILEANFWEEKARFFLEKTASLSEFEELIRSSEDIFATLPSLAEVREAVSVTHSWMERSNKYITHSSKVCDDVLKLPELKELINESKILKATSDISAGLVKILEKAEDWMQSAMTVIEEARIFFSPCETNINISTSLLKECDELLNKIDKMVEAGSSLGFDFEELPQLKQAAEVARWISIALSFCFKVPSTKEVETSIKDMDCLLGWMSQSTLADHLARGMHWLRRALYMFPDPKSSEKRCMLKDVESLLEEYQEDVVPYPKIVMRLQNSIKKHRRWVEQSRAFFVFPGQKSWTVLLKLKESGLTDAFDCREMDEIDIEFEKVNKWVRRCHDIMQSFVCDASSLSTQLEKLKRSLDKALCLYSGSSCMKQRKLCVCCPCDSDKEEAYLCPLCGDRYHTSCVGPPHAIHEKIEELACPFCLYMKKGDMSESETKAFICKDGRPELKSFVELTIAKGPYTGVRELDLVEEIVRQAKQCKTCLMQIVNKSNSYLGRDLSIVSQGLLIALKATAVAGIYSEHEAIGLELALAKYSWKVKTKKLLSASTKPTMEQLLCFEKEGLDLGIPYEDQCMHEMTEAKKIATHWLDRAKQVVSDSGELPLDKVYDLISDGENLPVHFESELKALRERSILYCICRKPYNGEDMIACDMCDEWYHFDCIKLCAPLPEKFYCYACQPSSCSKKAGKLGISPTSSKRSKKRQIKELETVDLAACLKSEMHNLWRVNTRPSHRTARRRIDFKTFPII
ncbi:hypothetical protein LUZ63_011306 [Rhynchospora breviuscula]|uniref:Uncharacterized protein n=1 Tax=Rhynchospora breviuscula TaxID=2022672 RepID=A0A9Q0CIU1_9POAL|nr:hypothetical protein LUZ63_011306 [Rhynchospora breviuscula]